MTQQLQSWKFIPDIWRLRCIQKPVHKCHGDLIFSNQNTETTYVPFSRQMAKQTEVHADLEVLLSNEKKWAIESCNDLLESRENCAEKKNPKRL